MEEGLLFQERVEIGIGERRGDADKVADVQVAIARDHRLTHRPPVVGAGYVAVTEQRALRVLRADCGPDEVPYPVFPDAGGLFPWGGTDNGDAMHWLTIGTPSEWTVAINESRGPMWEEYDCSMVEFLVRLLSGDIRSEILPEGFPSASPRFRVVTGVEDYQR